MGKLREIVWVGSSLKDLKELPEEVMDEIGFSLHQVQMGLTPDNAKPFKGLGAGIMEIVSDFDTDTYRSVYAVKLGEHIYVLHSFQKKSKTGIKTPLNEVRLIEQRLKKAKQLASIGEQLIC